MKTYLITKEYIDGNTETDTVCLEGSLDPWEEIEDGFDWVLTNVEELEDFED